MEHSAEYTLADGTEYRLTWDNEDKGGQMHYLLHEDGVLKLECWHHAIPQYLTDEELRSVTIPGSFFNCVSRHLTNKAVRASAEETGDEVVKQLTQLIARPHMTLSPEQEDYLQTVIDRGHNLEILLKLMQDAEVEAFARRLNEEPPAVVVGTTVTPEQRLLDAIRNGHPDERSAFRRNLPAILWASGVILVSGLAIFASEIFGG